MSSTIQQRKIDHLELCATDRVAFRKSTTLIDNIRLVHQSLPDLKLDDIDTRITLFGKELRAPIFIAAMTGGTDTAAEINQHLAAIADRLGYGFGLGSQRAMQKEPVTAWTYRVREWAPNVLLLGNLGVVQAGHASPDAIQTLADEVGVDAMCIHMNPAMELIQQDGDRDFRGGTETFKRLVEALKVPVVAKETGNGISSQTAQKLRDAGVQHVDVSGAGGTSWVGVEALRAQGDAQKLGEILWDWGVPTAASVHWSAQAGLTPIATGGIRHGYDIARAIAMGASAGGIARHALKALKEEGPAGAEHFLRGVETQLRAVMLLCGAQNIEQLQKAPKIITGELRDWINS